MAGASGSAGGSEWWRDAVVYQIYPRSFQDSDGDGIGDLRGAIARLDHLEWLGVDALWLSPIYPSPLADSGYDVADHAAIDPVYGSLADFDELVARAHARGLRVLLDLVASHTSIEHPWFREHPDWYVWADGGPPNNWRAAWGGPAWSRDVRSGRWYLHSFYPEQADLDWRNPEARAAIGSVIRVWRERGVDGFRVDAVQQLMKDRELRDERPARAPFPLPLHPELAALEGVRSRTDPEITIALDALREAAGDAVLVGEVYVPSAALGPYLERLDLAFAFEFLHAPWEAAAMRRAIAAVAQLERVAWVLSNHDFPRLATRLGDRAARAAAVLLLTLPGAAFIYQGDEIGMPDGPEGDPPEDRAGRDRHRNPMQWSAEPLGGFTKGEPWLPPIDPERRSVDEQRPRPDSLLRLYRRLIELRRGLRGEIELLDSPPGLLAYRRGEHAVAINVGDREVRTPVSGEVVLATEPTDGAALRPGGAVVLRRTGA
ncbi:MAG TPA: alpha-amylase family glycosyl hydrolase [Solirubrobacterales bacterium]|nr:alpha-amylase family glycosyl hydrolase [Solirubrobacterales bacterium]